jgi:hypothetical protein
MKHVTRLSVAVVGLVCLVAIAFAGSAKKAAKEVRALAKAYSSTLTGSDDDSVAVVQTSPTLHRMGPAMSRADEEDLPMTMIGFHEDNMGKVLTGGGDETVQEWKPKVHAAIASDDGTTAVLSFSFDYIWKNADNKRKKVKQKFRVTSVMEKVDGAWRVCADHWSAGSPNKTVTKAALGGSLIQPDPVALAQENEGPDDLVAAFVDQINNSKKVFADYTSDRKDVIVFGSDAKEVIKTGKKLKKNIKAWNLDLSVAGPVRAGIVCGNGVYGWAYGIVESKAKKGKKKYTVPYRTMFVYEKTKDGYELVAGHFSVVWQ